MRVAIEGRKHKVMLNLALAIFIIVNSAEITIAFDYLCYFISTTVIITSSNIDK